MRIWWALLVLSLCVPCVVRAEDAATVVERGAEAQARAQVQAQIDLRARELAGGVDPKLIEKEARERAKEFNNKQVLDRAAQIAEARAGKMSWLVGAPTAGLFNVGAYYGSLFATVGTCSLELGCTGVEDPLRKPQNEQALGISLSLRPLMLIHESITSLTVVGRLGTLIHQGAPVSGLTSAAALDISGYLQYALVGVLTVGAGAAGSMDTFTTLSEDKGGLTDTKIWNASGVFRLGVHLRTADLAGECRVGSWGGQNKDRKGFGSFSSTCGIMLTAWIW